MSRIAYVVGDATCPATTGPQVVAHVCNDIGAWGRGFVTALSRRWPEPEAAFRRWYAERATNDFGLGAVQLVEVDADRWVANLVGQHDIRRGRAGPAPVRYEAIDEGLRRLAALVAPLGAGVHMPRIACGLAGGQWSRVEPLVQRRLAEHGIPVTVYDPPDRGGA